MLATTALHPKELPAPPEPKALRKSFGLHLLVPGDDRQLFAATSATGGQDLAPVSGRHARAKPMGSLSPGIVGLIGPFHD